MNDGGFIASWLRAVGGQPIYVPEALVEIEAPSTLGPYVRQRRRIRFGFSQVKELTQVTPTTAQRSLMSNPGEVLRILRDASRDTPPGGWTPLWGLVVAEFLSLVAASWDRIVPGADHVRWATLPD